MLWFFLSWNVSNYYWRYSNWIVCSLNVIQRQAFMLLYPWPDLVTPVLSFAPFAPWISIEFESLAICLAALAYEHIVLRAFSHPLLCFLTWLWYLHFLHRRYTWSFLLRTMWEIQRFSNGVVRPESGRFVRPLWKKVFPQDSLNDRDSTSKYFRCLISCRAIYFNTFLWVSSNDIPALYFFTLSECMYVFM